ncbi:MAG: nucleotidyltransferase [Planctomycetes bacterium]|nr:nucleotidyltransferase [Planctomycetota bacterium]
MKSDQFSADVLDFLRLLSKHGVRYLLVGGTAVIYHGYARMTADVDFFFERTEPNVERMWNALAEF